MAVPFELRELESVSRIAGDNPLAWRVKDKQTSDTQWGRSRGGEGDSTNISAKPSMDAPRTRNPMSTGVCETCAERGRPNEPVYKLGMCEFCFKGLRHPKATREELTRERGRELPDMNTSSPQKR